MEEKGKKIFLVKLIIKLDVTMWLNKVSRERKIKRRLRAQEIGFGHNTLKGEIRLLTYTKVGLRL